MKINETNRVSAINPYQRAAEAKSVTNDKKANRKDEVSISPEAMEMLQANSTQASANAERAQKIQSVNLAGGNGNVTSKQHTSFC
ncbi:flagellar biosynthesis anti-sigma factor FlgM [Paenibacillus nuruki]|uniref:flagellar biosynthesis anti-sigma factor FlgM n=1 Tax=Paenibacillus nuruki TaxID=1886670 RepID=UPI002923CACC|nr:hypothetical protein AASFL403_21800 [Paenibacillus nuruki]